MQSVIVKLCRGMNRNIVAHSTSSRWGRTARGKHGQFAAHRQSDSCYCNRSHRSSHLCWESRTAKPAGFFCANPQPVLNALAKLCEMQVCIRYTARNALRVISAFSTVFKPVFCPKNPRFRNFFHDFLLTKTAFCIIINIEIKKDG